MNTSARSIPSRLSLRANFSWTFVGNVVYAACQWGMLVVMAKLGSPEMVGQFAFGLVITAPVMLFASLKMRHVLATDARHEYLFGDYLGLQLITVTLGLLVIVGIALLSGCSWETTLVILTIGIAKAFETISEVFYGLLQRHERMDRIGKSLMIKGPLSLVALSAGIYLTGNVLWGTMGLAVAWVSLLVGYDVRSGTLVLRSTTRPRDKDFNSVEKATLRPHWEKRALTRLAWLTLPLGVLLVLTSLRTNIPRYLVGYYLGERELGIFAAMAYVMVAGNTVVTALGDAATPRLANYCAVRDSLAFRTLLLKLVIIGGLLGGAGVLVAVVAGREILSLFYRPEYAEYNDVFVRLMVAAGIDYIATFLYFGMMAARYFRVQVVLFAIVTSTAALACLWLIPSDGLRGAATALIIATMVRVGGSLIILGNALSSPQPSEGG